MLATRYILFAILSTLVNLFSQFLTFLILDYEYEIYIAIASGTITGLLVKYLLDKYYIFNLKVREYRSKNTFVPYILTSVLTTIIFWFTELWFINNIQISNTEYIGAMVGLSIGYTLKYFLDRNFVFNEKN
tara:strand:- start:1151 stop:1543 length:393 start_codon:yes stop_codon:yes gene_type:complete